MIITPEPGRAKDIGQKLLAMAEDPRDVQWVTWPQAGFSIPLELFVKFSDGDKAAGGVLTRPVTIGEDYPPPSESPRPRRGRPRKQETESTDDTTTSPEEE